MAASTACDIPCGSRPRAPGVDLVKAEDMDAVKVAPKRARCGFGHTHGSGSFCRLAHVSPSLPRFGIGCPGPVLVTPHLRTLHRACKSRMLSGGNGVDIRTVQQAPVGGQQGQAVHPGAGGDEAIRRIVMGKSDRTARQRHIERDGRFGDGACRQGLAKSNAAGRPRRRDGPRSASNKVSQTLTDERCREAV